MCPGKMHWPDASETAPMVNRWRWMRQSLRSDSGGAPGSFTNSSMRWRSMMGWKRGMEPVFATMQDHLSCVGHQLLNCGLTQREHPPLGCPSSGQKSSPWRGIGMGSSQTPCILPVLEEHSMFLECLIFSQAVPAARRWQPNLKM